MTMLLHKPYLVKVSTKGSKIHIAPVHVVYERPKVQLFLLYYVKSIEKMGLSGKNNLLFFAVN